MDDPKTGSPRSRRDAYREVGGREPKAGAVGDARHDESLVEEKENTFSRRGAYRELGGRVTHGSVAEKARMRG